MLKGTGTSVSHYKYSVNNPTTHAEWELAQVWATISIVLITPPPMLKGTGTSVSHYKYSVNNPTTHAEGNWHKCEPL